jgi:LmbE family N-acetylglucosaminyl deacetylase
MRHDSTLRSDDEPSALDRRWREVHRHAESLRLPAVPTLVIAPHPDDETLLAGGLIATQRARDVDVHILAVTDGEDADGFADKRLARQRRHEQVEALAELGVDCTAVTRLGLPDGAVAEHIGAIADEIARFDRIGLVVAPWTGDPQCDHEAVGTAASDAVARTGGALIFGLFWTWHQLLPADLANERMLRLDLDGDAQLRRRGAIERHRSQFVPPVADRSFAHPSPPAPRLKAHLTRPLAWHAEFFLALRPSGTVVTDAQRHGTPLATGVPPVTSKPSAVAEPAA